jgi:hypothetical protein
MLAVQEQLGAGLFITLQLNFNKQADKATFVAQADTSFSSISEGFSAIQNITTKNNLPGYLEFLIFQSGGNAVELGQILSNDPKTGSYYLTTCNFATMSNCLDGVNGVLNYSTNSFLNQVGFQNGQPTGNPVSLQFTYMNYTDLRLTVGSSVVTPQAQEAVDNLTQTYLDTQPQMVLVNKIFTSVVGQNLDPTTDIILTNFASSVNYNNALITNPINGIMGCYSSPKDCLTIASAINENLQPINSTQINNVIADFQLGYVPTYNSISNPFVPNIFLPSGSNVYVPIPFDYLQSYSNPNGDVYYINLAMDIIRNDNVSISITQNNNVFQIFSISISGFGTTTIQVFSNESILALNEVSNNTFTCNFTCFESTDVFKPAATCEVELMTIELTAVDSGIF